MDDKILITQAEAAQILGCSVSTVSRCLRDGKLHYADERRRLLLRQGLEDRFRAATRPRVDVPQVKSAKAGDVSQAEHHATHQSEPVHRGSSHMVQPTPIATDDWDRLNQKLTVVMAGSPVYWQREPNAHQLMLFCKTIDELRGQCSAEGLEPD